jgi:signal transduction histidine kinase
LEDPELTLDPASILELSQMVAYAGETVGEAKIWLSKNDLLTFLNQSTINALKRIGLVVLVTFVISFFGALWLAQTLVKPIQQLVSGMRQMSDGNLKPVRVPRRKDELGWMGQELNTTIKKLAELDEMKRDFVAGVTHELRSPLAAILSMTGYLRDHPSRVSLEEERNSLITIQNNTNRLMKFVDDLLSTAKLESAKMSLDCRRFDIYGPICEVGNLYRDIAKEKGIDLKIDCPPKKFSVWADPDKVSHILINLVSNAFKYTQKGTVTIRAQREDPGVRVSVTDTGIGIGESERKNLFEKFYRVKNPATKTKGVGLGLFLSKNLVELHGGRMTVESRLGHGSTFSFTLPQSQSRGAIL